MSGSDEGPVGPTTEDLVKAIQEAIDRPPTLWERLQDFLVRIGLDRRL